MTSDFEVDLSHISEVVDLIIEMPDSLSGLPFLLAAKSIGSDPVAALAVESFRSIAAKEGKPLALTAQERATLARVISQILCEFPGITRLAGGMLEDLRKEFPKSPAVVSSVS